MAIWARQRQIYYLVGVFVFFALIGLVLFLIYRPRPSCFDGVQNQAEAGVDCGGPCAIACAPAVIPLKIYWTRPLLVAPGWYDIATQVENTNLALGVRQAGYTIYLYDNENNLLIKRTGSTFINPGEKFVIFENRLITNGREAKQAFLEFDKDLVWEKAQTVPKIITVERENFVETPRPQLKIRVTNQTLDILSDVKLTAVLSDADNNAFAASATLIDRLGPNESRLVFLTWPSSFTSPPSSFDFYWRLNSFDQASFSL